MEKVVFSNPLVGAGTRGEGGRERVRVVGSGQASTQLNQLLRRHG
jgi:hypothetical protein